MPVSMPHKDGCVWPCVLSLKCQCQCHIHLCCGEDQAPQHWLMPYAVQTLLVSATPLVRGPLSCLPCAKTTYPGFTQDSHHITTIPQSRYYCCSDAMLITPSFSAGIPPCISHIALVCVACTSSMFSAGLMLPLPSLAWLKT